MQEQEKGWKRYYTIPSDYEDFLSYLKGHQEIRKFVPKDDENFIVQMVFEKSKEDDEFGWYLMIMNYTKKITTQIHVFKIDNNHFPQCKVRFRKHGFFKKWTNWENTRLWKFMGTEP